MIAIADELLELAPQGPPQLELEPKALECEEENQE